mmetsp:Transcript_23018/g.75021  ORF Transcript_23018/g.75021 Transcript_23018/m.75021 type:complete len:257 (-) Transcript_23018:8-778(-)
MIQTHVHQRPPHYFFAAPKSAKSSEFAMTEKAPANRSSESPASAARATFPSGTGAFSAIADGIAFARKDTGPRARLSGIETFPIGVETVRAPETAPGLSTTAERSTADAANPSAAFSARIFPSKYPLETEASAEGICALTSTARETPRASASARAVAFASPFIRSAVALSEMRSGSGGLPTAHTSACTSSRAFSYAPASHASPLTHSTSEAHAAPGECGTPLRLRQRTAHPFASASWAMAEPTKPGPTIRRRDVIS